jgi:hypothetical protein
MKRPCSRVTSRSSTNTLTKQLESNREFKKRVAHPAARRPSIPSPQSTSKHLSPSPAKAVALALPARRAIGFADHCVCHVRAALHFTHPGICARALQFRSRGPRGKGSRRWKAKRCTPCRKSGSGQRQREQRLCDAGSKPIPSGSRFAYPARCAEPNCQTQINSGECCFYYPGDKSLYGSRCGHGEKAERDFAAHRIEEDSY